MVHSAMRKKTTGVRLTTSDRFNYETRNVRVETATVRTLQGKWVDAFLLKRRGQSQMIFAPAETERNMWPPVD